MVLTIYQCRLCFKVVTKEFRVLSHDKLKTPQKFWGAGPVPKGHHRQIDESLSDVSSDDNNDTSANNDNQRESIEMEQNDVQNGPGDNEEITTQIDDKQQTASDKQTPAKRSNSSTDKPDTKRARVGGFGPSVIDMTEETVASARYSFYNYEGAISSKRWQTYGAVMIKESKNVLAKHHQYKTKTGSTVCIAAISRGGNGVITIHATDSGDLLLRFQPTDLVAYIGVADQLLIDQCTALWNSSLPEEELSTPIQRRETPHSPYRPPQQSSNVTFDNSNNEARLDELEQNYENLQRKYDKLTAQVKSLSHKLLEYDKFKEQMQHFMNGIQQDNEANLKKLKKLDKKLKRNVEYSNPATTGMPMAFSAPYVMPPSAYPMPMLPPSATHHFSPRY